MAQVPLPWGGSPIVDTLANCMKLDTGRTEEIASRVPFFVYLYLAEMSKSRELVGLKPSDITKDVVTSLFDMARQRYEQCGGKYERSEHEEELLQQALKALIKRVARVLDQR